MDKPVSPMSEKHGMYFKVLEIVSTLQADERESPDFIYEATYCLEDKFEENQLHYFTEMQKDAWTHLNDRVGGAGRSRTYGGLPLKLSKGVINKGQDAFYSIKLILVIKENGEFVEYPFFHYLLGRYEEGERKANEIINKLARL